jgi:hypothetical protein
MRTWFMGRVGREKFLLVFFVLAVAVLWGSRVWDNGRVVSTEVALASSNLENQALWLSRRETIEARARAAVANLDGSKTFNTLRLSAELSTLARQAGIDANMSSETLPVDETVQFRVHSLDVSLAKVPWDNLNQFYQELSKRAPYIIIESFSLSAVANQDTLLNARLRVSSVEITKS